MKNEQRMLLDFAGHMKFKKAIPVPSTSTQILAIEVQALPEGTE